MTTATQPITHILGYPRIGANVALQTLSVELFYIARITGIKPDQEAGS